MLKRCRGISLDRMGWDGMRRLGVEVHDVDTVSFRALYYMPCDRWSRVWDLKKKGPWSEDEAEDSYYRRFMLQIRPHHGQRSIAAKVLQTEQSVPEQCSPLVDGCHKMPVCPVEGRRQLTRGSGRGWLRALTEELEI